ncbi:MAG: hypothetical protein NZ959_03555 [Armatimonadetes bacterium]|nr:hypothetical protein [Armatimonadota bacterium]MDW8121718.1 hypothetical protein [Armatimonadota bacterium]
MDDVTDRRLPPKERLKEIQYLVQTKPRHPYRFLWRALTWAGVACRRNLIALKLRRDEELRQRLIKGIVSEQFPRGSFRSSIGWTGLRLYQLAELGCPKDHPAIRSALEWLFHRQDIDGSLMENPRVPTAYPTLWGEEVRFPPVSLGVTAFCLCGILRYDTDSWWVKRAVHWVAQTVLEQRKICCRSCAVHALHCLQRSRSDSPLVVSASERILHWLGEHQAEKGDWFASLDATYGVVFAFGVRPTPESYRQIHRALPLLAASQYEDGGWGRSHRTEKTYLITRALVIHELLESFMDLTDKCPWLVRSLDQMDDTLPTLDEAIGV